MLELKLNVLFFTKELKLNVKIKVGDVGLRLWSVLIYKVLRLI